MARGQALPTQVMTRGQALPTSPQPSRVPAGMPVGCVDAACYNCASPGAAIHPLPIRESEPTFRAVAAPA